MKQEFVIKKSPLLKIILRKREFEMINHQYKEENGVFSYSKLNSFYFKERSTNYIKNIIFTLLNFFLPAQGDYGIKSKERIIMNYDGQERKFILFDFDQAVVMEAIIEINKRIN